ncbi:MAG: hypothetical protein NUV61_04475, partial [Candidatus Azambacteria bacterium]|nr:hypothetical protein [Candidatus Azambacteria bacterium]
NMGFHYKNFITAVVICIMAFGGFFSFVYSAEQGKSKAKKEGVSPVQEKQYDKKDVERIHEVIVATQRTMLANEVQRITTQKQSAPQAAYTQTQNRNIKKVSAVASVSSSPLPLAPLVLPKVSVAILPPTPQAPVVPAPIIKVSPPQAPITSIASVTPSPQIVQAAKPRTTVS